MDFLWEPGNVIELSSALIKRHNPAWKTDQLGFRMGWAAALPPDRYAILDRLDEPLQIAYTQEGWRGRIRASAGVSASMAPEIIPVFDREHERLLHETYGDAVLAVPHRLYMFIARAL